MTDSPPHIAPNPLLDTQFIVLLQELQEWSGRPLWLDDPTTSDEGFADVVNVEELLRRLHTRVSRPGHAYPFPRLFYLVSCYEATGTTAQRKAIGATAVTRAKWHTRELCSAVDNVLGSGPSTAVTLHRRGFVQVVGYYGPIGDELSTQVEGAF